MFLDWSLTDLPINKHARFLLIIIYIAAALLFVWLFFRFLLPWIAPFILAFITASIIEPAVNRLSKKLKLRRQFVSVICSMLVLIAVIGLVIFITSRAIYEIITFAKELPDILSGVPNILTTIENKIYGYIVAAPVEIQDYMISAIDDISAKISQFPTLLSGKLLAILSSVASLTPKIILFAVTYAISVFFISSSYIQIKEFIIHQIPVRLQRAARNIKSDLISTLGKWLKAQFILMSITFSELTVAFLLLRIDYAALLALIISLVDALPVLGTGTVLIPWAIITFLYGDVTLAINLSVLYLIISIIRSFLEPKIIGNQVGLNPLVTLIAMYVGFCSIGITGMIFFPLIFVILKQLIDKGYIKRWKQV